MKLCKGALCGRRSQLIKNICCSECEPTIYVKCKQKTKCTYFQGRSVFTCQGLKVDTKPREFSEETKARILKNFLGRNEYR